MPASHTAVAVVVHSIQLNARVHVYVKKITMNCEKSPSGRKCLFENRLQKPSDFHTCVIMKILEMAELLLYLSSFLL